MQTRTLAAWLLSLALGAACAPPARRPRPRPLPPEARKQVDRKYYEAVDAYMKTDYAHARALIREILASDPAHADARSLLVRVKAVEQASARP